MRHKFFRSSWVLSMLTLAFMLAQGVFVGARPQIGRWIPHSSISLSPDRIQALVADVGAYARAIDDGELASSNSNPLQVRNDGIEAEPLTVVWAPAPAIRVTFEAEPIWSAIEGLDPVTGQTVSGKAVPTVLASTVPAEPLALPSVVSVPTATVSADAFESPKPLVTMPRSAKKVGSGDTVLRRSLIVSFSALQALDAHSTLKALRSGAVEANPLMSGLASSPGAFLTVKMGTAAAAVYLAERLARTHPKRAVVLMVVLNSVFAAVVGNNYRVMPDQR